MYSGNHKFGRGGGGGGGGGGATKRKVFGAPPPQRLSSSSSSGRLSLGGSRNPASSSAPASAAASSEETFSLVGGNPLSFAAIIRLAPDLVEEIKRVEAEGGAAKIKFDSNPNNSLGNVIDVGGKEFRFTWSRETGDLCDIYEERQNDEDGNGLLVESGCAWRKLNVQRVLDESAKNHVKRLSEEAERQFKSRKAKFLDPSNASMKSQMKALAAAEASPWKFKHKKDYVKKRSFEPPQVGGPPVAAHKSGLPTTGAAKGRYSASPLPSPQNQSVSLASPSMKGNATENQAIMDGTTHIQPRKKENTLGVEKDLTSRSSDGLQESAACRDNQVEGAKDVQNLLITLLKENPKGMNMKTLEKAVADRTSNSARKIEPLLEKIATFRPPGIYVLKTAVELGSQKRSSSDIGSSPGESQQKHCNLEDNLESASASVLVIKSPPEDLEERGQMDESNLVEKIDPSQHFSDLFGDDEPPENSEGQAASSRGTGSDSDSDSSDSGSDSGSRSRSRSPAETANGSGSDSENDSSSNTKDGSDVEIDILNDDDKGPKKFHDAEQGLSRASAPWSMPDAEPLQDGNLRDQEGFASEDIDIDKDFLGDNEAELASVSRAPAVPTENLKTVSAEHRQNRLYGVTDMYHESEDVDEELKHEQPDSLMMFKGNSKRGSDASQFEDNSEHFKRLKSGSMAQSSMSGYMGGISPRSSPDITNEYHQDNHNLQVSDSYDRNDNSNLGGQRGDNHPVPGKFSPDLLQSGPRPPIRSHDIETADKFGKIPRNWGLDVKHQEANPYRREGFLKQGEKGRKGTRDGESTLNENINGKFKGGAFDKKLDMRAEPQYEKHGEEGKKSLTMGSSSRLQAGSSPKDGGQASFDRSSVDNRRLQRELSDLELGELREPLAEEHEVTKKQFERVGSFKQSDTKSSTSGSQNAGLRGKPAGKPTVDIASPSLPTSRAGGLKKMNNWSKRSPEPSAEDTSRPCHQTPQCQQQQPRVSHTEVGYVLSKAADVNRLRPNEGAVNEETDVEGYGESQKKSHAQLEESKQDPHSRKVKGSRSLKSNLLTDASDRRKDASSTEGRNDKRKRSGSSLDEDVSYSKYEKEEPELKGPIKNFSQYSEYVQDYCEKYESYCSLNTILESYRSEFQKLGTDLESAKDRDMERYYNILAQLRESYRQCGTRHKRLKKIFIVLHEELKHLKQRIKEFAVEYMRD